MALQSALLALFSLTMCTGFISTGPPSAQVYPASSCPAPSTTNTLQRSSIPTHPAFCSLVDAASWISALSVKLGPEAPVRVCLHPGVHSLREPLHLNASHSFSQWAACDPEQRTVISGGVKIAADMWHPDPVTAGLWTASVPAEVGNLEYMRTLFINGVRANRTVANATRLLGSLQCNRDGYTTEKAVSWSSDAEQVELNYFQQLAAWQAPRCVLTHAADHSLTVMQPCLNYLNQRVASIPGLPRNRSSGRTGCADTDPGCGNLQGSPLGSGLPMFVENIPLTDPALPTQSISDGLFSFSPRQQRVWLLPHEQHVARGGFDAEIIVPVAEGLVQAVGLTNVLFEGIDFEHSAWNGPSRAAGFVDGQDGFTTTGGSVPGGLDCTNCSYVTVLNCSFKYMGGSGVTFGDIAQHISISSTTVADVSGNGIVVGNSRNTSAPFQSTDNTVEDCEIDRVGQEFTDASAIVAGYSIRLNISHNTLTNLPYGGINIGAGAAHPGYARNNTVTFNRIDNWMLKMQDSAGIHVTGRQPGSVIRSNFISRQGLTGLEPPPNCDNPLRGQRCSLDEVVAYEDRWIAQIGKPYNISSCNRTSDGWCNQTGNSHGGGIYMDNGSGGWEVTGNVLSGIYNWMFVWDGRPGKMVNMSFHHNWVDSWLFSNNAVGNQVSAQDNILVSKGAWPDGAKVVMQNAGARVCMRCKIV